MDDGPVEAFLSAPLGLLTVRSQGSKIDGWMAEMGDIGRLPSDKTATSSLLSERRLWRKGKPRSPSKLTS